MANYSAIKAAVNAYIKQNGRKEITGKVLNAVLNAVIDSLGRYFQFAGGAMPNDDPGTPDQNVCYLATEPGLYVNFGNIRIENEEVALLFWNGDWVKQTITIGIQEVNASVDNQVGTPSVDVNYSEGQLSLTFHNLKGDPGTPGNTGEPAGFGNIGADVEEGVGTPGVSVETSGDNKEKNMFFHFRNLKGDPGLTGAEASVDNNTGIPSVDISINNGVLTLSFHNLKGLQGNTGSSVDYPFTLVNNTFTDDALQALTAAMGKYLQDQIDILSDLVRGYDQIELTQDDFDVSIGIIRLDGEFSLDPSAPVHGRHGLIMFPPGSRSVKVTANSSGATYYAFLTSDVLVNGEMSPFVPGTALVTLPAGDIAEVDIPDGSVYFYIYCSTADTGDLERFPEEIMLYGTGEGLVDRVAGLETEMQNQFVRVVNASTYKGVTHFGFIGLDGTFNSSEGNQHILLPLSGIKRVSVRANNNGATYIAFLTSVELTPGESAPFAAKTNLINLASGQSSGILDVPIDAEYLYVFISIFATDWARFPYVNLFREHILVDNPFAVIDNDFSDLSIFSGLNEAMLSPDGYSPEVGYNSKKVTINRLVTADNYKLCYYITLGSQSTIFACGSVGNLVNRCSLVSFDFGTGKINFHNPSTSGASETAIKSSADMLSVTGNIYRLEVGRRDRAVYAAVTNLTTGIRTEYMPTDTSGKGTDYGWFYDNPTFAIISGSCTISRIVETMPTKPFMVFLGDSITAGYGVSYEDCWARKACEHFGGNSFISARSNGTITEMMKKVVEEIPMIRPKFVVLTIGTNGGDNMQNMMQIRDLIKGFGAIPIINCIYQRSGTSHIATDEAVNDIILSLGCLCSRFDLATSLNNIIADGGNPAYFQSDGLHLNADGNQVVYERFLSDMSIIFQE